MTEDALHLKAGIDNGMCYLRSIKRYAGKQFTADEQKILDGLERAWEIAEELIADRDAKERRIKELESHLEYIISGERPA